MCVCVFVAKEKVQLGNAIELVIVALMVVATTCMGWDWIYDSMSGQQGMTREEIW